MRWEPLPFVDGAYADDAKPFSSQDVQNWLPVAAEMGGGRSNTMLRTPPGLQEFATIGDRHRGARNVEGKLFVVSGTALYLVDRTGGAANLGTIPGRSRVSMTHNQITNGNELVIGTGSAGYVYNTVTGVLTQITDDGFPGFLVCDYINSLVIGIEPLRRFFFNSSLADATAYDTVERYESESSPDRLRSLIVDHQEVWLFNERTTEIFDNATDATNIANHILFTNKRIVIEQGCASTFAVCKLDNSVWWLGSDGGLYRANGYTPQRISTQALEKAWKDCDLSKAFMFTWADRGHKVVYLTFPDGYTWGYDVAAGKFHRRQSQGMDRWRLNTLVEWNNAWYGGAYNTGILYRLDWDFFAEGSDEMVSERTGPVLHDNQNFLTVDGIEFVFDTGGPASTAETAVSLTLSGDLPGGTVGASGAYNYTVTGGTAPVVVSISGGSLPTGLSMNSSGVVTGNFSATGAFSWTVKALDADGTTATLNDAATVTDTAVAVTLLADMDHWWSFDSDRTNEITAAASLDLGVGGVEPTYQGGKRISEAQPNSVLATPGSTFGGSLSTDCSFWCWLNVVGTAATNRLKLGLSSSTTGQTIRVILGIEGSGTSIALYVDDASDADIPGVSETVAPGSRYFCRVNLNWTAKTAELFVDEVSQGVTTAVTSLWGDMSHMMVRANNGTDVTAAPDFVDEMGVIIGRVTTATEGAYLYNDGTGKSYADIVADAA